MSLRVVFDSGLFPPLYENMTSSTNPEIHNCRHRRTEPWLQVTCREIWGDFEICERTDKQTDKQKRRLQYFASLTLQKITEVV